MDATAVAGYIREAFPGVETTTAYTYTFFFYGAERMLPFATLATADNEHDRVSDLDRPGVYRLNIGVSRETYRALLGDEKPRLGPSGIIDTGHDFTRLDEILPHPHYAPQSWVCVLSPCEQTFEVVRGLLREAYDRAVLRATRKETSEPERTSAGVDTSTPLHAARPVLPEPASDPLSAMPNADYPLVDLALARRLERTEAGANAAFVTARARLKPEIGATWTEVAGAYALFDGIGSPLTQSFGLGLFADPSHADFDVIESFFRERGAEVHHEISPLADASLLPRLTGRGYQPVELSSILFRPVPREPLAMTGEDGLRVRRVGPEEAELWARVSADGWNSESAEVAAFVLEMGQVSARSEGMHCFLAELDGAPAAAGGLYIGDGVALLAGASTLPALRGRGAQRALLRARLGFAAEQGCDLVMIGASPGSASQRNAERQGFRIAYTRIKWHLPQVSG